MSAPDYPTLYKFEYYLETAVKTVLAADGLTCAMQRDTSDLATPRVEVQVIMGVATGHLKLTSWGLKTPDAWRCTIRLGIVTRRSKNNTNHDDYRAKARYRMYDYRTTTKINTLMSYHELAPEHSLFEESCTPTVEREGELDYSTLNFAGLITIRSAAWPVETP